jgi:hypothetical protein
MKKLISIRKKSISGKKNHELYSLKIIQMKWVVSVIFIWMAFPSGVIFGQPANDDCPGAAVLNQTAECTPVSGTTVDATQSIPPVTCSGYTGYADDDVWYIFTAVTTNPTIYVTGDPSFDAVVDLRSDLCDGTSIYCVDAKGPGGTEKLYPGGLALGASYYIRIYSNGYGVGAQGTFTVCVFGAPPYPPINDECYNALAIDYPFSYGSTLSATKSIDPITCQGITGSSDDDVWFKFDAPSVNPTITVVGETYFDAVVDLRSGPCDGSPLFCADASPMGGTEVIKASGLTVGTTYLVRVYSYGDGSNFQGGFTISVAETVCLTCPDFDFYLSAGPDWQVHSSLISSLGCNKYKLSVSDGNQYTFKTGCGDGATAEFDSYLELFDFNCDSVGGDDNSCEAGRSKIVWEATYDGYAYLDLHGSNPEAYGSYSLAYEISDPASIIEPDEITPLADFVKVFPNPASGEFQIESGPVSFTRVFIYDCTGRLIRILGLKAAGNSFCSNTRQMTPGLYILAIETNNGWIHKRFEIVR